MCSQLDDPTTIDRPAWPPLCPHGAPDYGAIDCRARGCFGCDGAYSVMSGHSGRCSSPDEHIALLKQGIGIGKRFDESTTDLIAGDHELIASEFHGRYPR